ncbi:hypothetical protein CASFOL_009551 [Castilleja foliolosa]|uniref:Uncharacterized protein n=1 Tax=Castilleja foliolosa TaxID=1961234 RepID=A0ABD3B796_9LAMI
MNSPIERTELLSFADLVILNYQSNSVSFPMISQVDVKAFIEKLVEYKEGDGLIYDPIMEPLVQSSLAHFLYLKKNGMEIIDLKSYHQNDIRLSFLDHLVANKSSITLSWFFEFAPSTASMDKNQMMFQISQLLVNPTLKEMDLLQLDTVLPSWGFTAKVRSASIAPRIRIEESC